MLHENDLAGELAELVRMEVNLHERLERVTSNKAIAINVDIESMLRRWLNKVKEIASSFQAKDFTITLALSWPPGIQASFNFPTNSNDLLPGKYR